MASERWHIAQYMIDFGQVDPLKCDNCDTSIIGGVYEYCDVHQSRYNYDTKTWYNDNLRLCRVCHAWRKDKEPKVDWCKNGF